MNLDNFILMGSFKLNDLIIKDHKTGFNGGLLIIVAKQDEPTHFMGVLIANNNNFDIVGAMRKQTHVNINGRIFKNPKTEKVLYIVDDAKSQIESI